VADLRPAFGQRVRQLRLERALTQEQLAERAGMHWTYISGVERGRRNPSLNVLGQLAGALGLSLADLLTGVDQGSKPLRRRADRPATTV
jgi:transcriptional regulator with XRE-family HTH domain